MVLKTLKCIQGLGLPWQITTMQKREPKRVRPIKTHLKRSLIPAGGKAPGGRLLLLVLLLRGVHAALPLPRPALLVAPQTTPPRISLRWPGLRQSVREWSGSFCGTDGDIT
jgi:hypothetical protein